MEAEKNSKMQKSLASGYYRTGEIFALEKERIFCREWFCAAREEQIPAAGDALVLNVAGESVIVARTKEGEIRAHYNVCRHRGSRLLAEPGEVIPSDIQLNGGVLGANGIRCPYHMWTYGLDGKLLNAPCLAAPSHLFRSAAAFFSLLPLLLLLLEWQVR